MHCVAGDPADRSQPSRSLVKVMSVGGTGGRRRSSQVAPRSAERKSRVPATRAHTRSPDGALSVANDGSGIGVCDAVADACAEAVTLGPGVVLGAALVDAVPVAAAVGTLDVAGAPHEMRTTAIRRGDTLGMPSG